MAQTNPLQLDRVQNEAMRVMLGATKDTCTHKEQAVHARPPTDANQTESGAGHSILQCRRKSPQPQSPGEIKRREVSWTLTKKLAQKRSKGGR